jgi:protein involved in polysaccharide export with SLBB domain
MKTLVLSLLFFISGLVASALPLPAVAQASAGTDQEYKLGAGDKVHVNVFGQSDLTGDFVVDGTGAVQLPLIGQIKAAGLTIQQFEVAIADALRSGQYLKDPRVSVQISGLRPFYIIGEVNKPGEYPCVNDMSVLNAVALAGGYTFRANDSVVYIRRSGEEKEQEFPSDQTTKVHPGDIVRVGERFF